MNNNIFNTDIETSLRILINLNTINKSVTKDELIVSDFLAIYGKLFGITDYNLHGDSPLSKSEYTVKRDLMQNVIKSLVLDELLLLHTNNGFKYSISTSGKELCNKLKTQYSEEYSFAVIKAYEYLNNNELIKVINLITSTTVIGG